MREPDHSPSRAEMRGAGVVRAQKPPRSLNGKRPRVQQHGGPGAKRRRRGIFNFEAAGAVTATGVLVVV